MLDVTSVARLDKLLSANGSKLTVIDFHATWCVRVPALVNRAVHATPSLPSMPNWPTMSSQKTSNNDSCKDLNGRRLSTVKEAKKIAQYLEDEPLRRQAELKAKKAKLEALEKQLGISTQATNAEARPSNAGAGPSNAGDKGKGKEPEKLAGKKHRFEDTEYLE
ncbi:hypothetical protein FRC01_008291 [Tulasnella sp. 417]|nr:hypothetical protein FRC01_008291 [Tulasnella sp. 417]